VQCDVHVIKQNIYLVKAIQLQKKKTEYHGFQLHTRYLQFSLLCKTLSVLCFSNQNYFRDFISEIIHCRYLLYTRHKVTDAIYSVHTKFIQFYCKTVPILKGWGQGLNIKMATIDDVLKDCSSYIDQNCWNDQDNKCGNKQKKQTLWPLVRERTIPTDRPPLVDEI
jgi:hypothetical protein